MIYLELLIGFLEVGCFAFGGAYAAIPLMRDVVISYGWISDEMLTYMIAVSESTPGPIMINLATYVGTQQAGILGALIATFGVVFPSFVVIILISALMSKVISNRYVQAALGGLKPAMIGIILGTGAYMIIKSLFTAAYTKLSIRAVIITALLAIFYFGINPKLKKPFSPIGLIIISAIIGIIGYAF